jgi:hypothetical protein
LCKIEIHYLAVVIIGRKNREVNKSCDVIIIGSFFYIGQLDQPLGDFEEWKDLIGQIFSGAWE